jgi:alanine dehydrogenase
VTLIVTREDVARVIDMADVMVAVERAHAEHARGNVAMPNRFTVRLPGGESAILPMAAALPGIGAVGVKLLSIFPGNRARGLPVLGATVLLVDPQTGTCEAVVDGGLLTAYRTASASAVATKYLAREHAHVLGLVGLGVEARSHLAAMRLVRPIDRVVGWTRSRATADRFVEEAAGGLPVEIVSSPEEVVRAADILCTLTPATEPIVRGAWLRPGMHINAVGTHENTAREIDTEAVVRARVVVDILASVLDECGDLNIPVAEGAITPQHFGSELGQVATGLRPPRQDDQEITLFKSVGVAIQDIATAHLVVQRAREAGLGTEIALSGG